MRIYSLTIKNRLTAIAVAVGVVGIGVLFVFAGVALLAALTVAGAVLGTGFAAYRWLRGERTQFPRAHDPGLDPALEVRPRTQPIAPSRERTDDTDDTDGSTPTA
ncbi:MAG: hypothetical protein ACM3SX_05760 [Deltaproteobacteria bacterium]